MLSHTDPAGHAARRNRYFQLLGTDAALVVSPPHHHRNADSEYRYRQCSDLFYLTGWEDPESVALFRPGSELPFVLFVQPKDAEREVWTGVREGVPGAKERYGADAAFPIAEFGSRIGQLLQGYESLQYRFGDDASLDAQISSSIRSYHKVAHRNGAPLPWRFIDPARTLGEMRLLKEPAEIDLLREAGRISAEAHVLAMRTGRPGVHEYEVEAAVDGYFRKKGGNGPGYTTIVGGGKNACILHYITNREVLTKGDLCLVDAGCEYRYYTADITRTFPVSGKFSGPQKDLYNVVLAAQLDAIDCARVGRPFRDMHDAAIRRLSEGLVDLGFFGDEADVDEVIVEEKYKKYYMHGTGHWLGLDVHDAGAYWQGFASRPLQAGMVLTVEPGLYIPIDDNDAPKPFRGIGIRIEDDIHVTEGEPDNLTAACPKTIKEVEAACRG